MNKYVIIIMGKDGQIKKLIIKTSLFLQEGTEKNCTTENTFSSMSGDIGIQLKPEETLILRRLDEY